MDDPTQHPRPAEEAADEPSDADDQDELPSAEQPANRATRIRARAGADVTAMLTYADGLRRAVELAERSRDDPDAYPDE